MKFKLFLKVNVMNNDEPRVKESFEDTTSTTIHANARLVFETLHHKTTL